MDNNNDVREERKSLLPTAQLLRIPSTELGSVRGRLDTGRSEGHRVQICAFWGGDWKDFPENYRRSTVPGTELRSSSRSRAHIKAKALPRTLLLSPQRKGVWS